MVEIASRPGHTWCRNPAGNGNSPIWYRPTRQRSWVNPPHPRTGALRVGANDGVVVIEDSVAGHRERLDEFALGGSDRFLDPNSSKWATPTLVTTPTSGRAIRARAAMCPIPRAPISVTMTSCSAVAPRSVSGRPISSLNDPGAECTFILVASTARTTSFVDVLPVEPVIATTARSDSPRSREASPWSAAIGDDQVWRAARFVG